MINKVISFFRYYYIKFLSKGVSVSYLSRVDRNSKLYVEADGSIRLAGKFRLFPFSTLFAKGQLSVGKNFSMNSYSRIMALGRIDIGNNVLIAQFVTILDHDHSYYINKDSGDLVVIDYVVSPIIIGNNVWIGDKVTITKGVKIGDNVIIGANSLINKDVPSNVVVGGVPFRILKNL